MITYSQYLLGEHWDTIKSQSSSLYGNRCVVCESAKQIHRHHLFYEDSISKTLPHHVVPLCRECHSVYHGISKNGGINTKVRRRQDANIVINEMFQVICDTRFRSSEIDIKKTPWYRKHIGRTMKIFKEQHLLSNIHTERNR